MKVLVTGTNGLLGQKLVALLSQDLNITLIATGRGPNRNLSGSYVYFRCDLTVEGEVATLFRIHRPDAVVHCAAMTQVDECELKQEECFQANVSATKYIIRGCESSGAFLLFVSTDFVFDGADGPYTEEDLPNPISFYGESKFNAEEAVKASNLEWAIVRTVLVYGVAHDMSRNNIVLWVKNNLEQFKRIKVVNDQWRTPTLAEDLAEGCFRVILNREQGIFHLSGEEMMTPFELATRTADFFQLDKTLISAVDATVFKQPGRRPPKTGFNISRAKRQLGFQPRSFSEGLLLLNSQLK